MAFLSLICFSINHNHSKARPRACTIHIMYKMIQIGLSTEHKKLLYVLYSAFTLVCVPRCVLCQYPTYYRRSSRYANLSYANSTYATFKKNLGRNERTHWNSYVGIPMSNIGIPTWVSNSNLGIPRLGNQLLITTYFLS